ncbi:MAG: chromate efflux transporter [Chitinophagales bacterium]
MQKISFKEAFLFWLKLGFISFGGPAGQIAIMHEYLVEKKKWISESRFLHALNYCMLLPGPEAQQLATYTGWLMHGTLGGVIAGLLFILPSIIIMLALSVLYVQYHNLQLVTAIFDGIKPAVAAIIFVALLKIGEKALKRPVDFAIAAFALAAIYFVHVPYPLVIFAALAAGLVHAYIFKTDDEETIVKGDDDESSYYINNKSAIDTSISIKRVIKLLLVFAVLWMIPLGVLFLLQKNFGFWQKLITFFSGAAVVTFGGAYSVLTYVSQEAVNHLRWLSMPEMMDGLAMGESTPGPLIMVLTFVGFMGSYRNMGFSVGWGAVGLLVTTFYTFLPSFAFILFGAPIVEATQENKSIKKALSFVTAAVVGVIANLFLFIVMALYRGSCNEEPNMRIRFAQLVWLVISVIAIKKFNVNMVLWLVISALAGLGLFLLPFVK